MLNPSKKKHAVKVGAKNPKVGKFMPKAPIKSGMATPAVDAKMSKITPKDKQPSFIGMGGKNGDKMKPIGAQLKARKKKSAHAKGM